MDNVFKSAGTLLRKLDNISYRGLCNCKTISVEFFFFLKNLRYNGKTKVIEQLRSGVNL